MADPRLPDSSLTVGGKGLFDPKYPAHEPALAQELEADPLGYRVRRRLIPEELVQGALRCLTLEIGRRGLTPDEIQLWSHSTFFPYLRWDPAILALRESLNDIVRPLPQEQWADAQLLLRFPDEATSWPLEPHVDELPHWAGPRRYRVITGVPLSRSRRKDGCLVVWPGSHRGERGGEATPVELEPGDAVFMHPDLLHCSTLNAGSTIRFVIYYRLLGG